MNNKPESGANLRRAFSIDEVSKATSLSKAFIRLEIKRGKLSASRFGRRVLVLSSELDRYLSAVDTRKLVSNEVGK